MAIVNGKRGYFFSPPTDSDIALQNPLEPILGEETTWRFGGVFFDAESDSGVRLFSYYGSGVEKVGGSARVRLKGSAAATINKTVNISAEPQYVGVSSDGSRLSLYIGDDSTPAGSAASSAGYDRGNFGDLVDAGYEELGNADGKYISIASVFDASGNELIRIDANLVPNAAGDGWVSRKDAIAGRVAAISGYENFMYDILDLNSSYNAPLPDGYSTLYIGDASGSAEVRAGESGLLYTLPSDFIATTVDVDGFPLALDASSAGSATISTPAMGDVSGLVKFGQNKVLTFTDAQGDTATTNVSWLPTEGYDYKDLTGANTTDQASIFYNWGVAGTDYEDAVPPVAGDQIVYDTAYYSNISTTGIITIADGAPASFTSEAYLIDDDGMQAFNTDSGEGIPAVNPPTATIETAAQTLEAGTTLQLAATVTDADTIAWTTSGSGSFTDATVEDAEFIAGSGGEVETLTLSATNTDGTTTATVDITVNAAVTDSTLNATITNIPDGTYDTRVLSDSGEVLFFGPKAWSGESASFTLTDVPAGTDVEYYAMGSSNGGGSRGVTE